MLRNAKSTRNVWISRTVGKVARIKLERFYSGWRLTAIVVILIKRSELEVKL